MIGDRMQRIVHFIEKHPVTNYKEIAAELHMKERQVRYDIERINNILMEKTEFSIERKSKGVLVYSGKQPLSAHLQILMFSAQQRLDFIMLQVLFDTEYLNMNRLRVDFGVSRSSIKHDVDTIAAQLKKYGCELYYDQVFQLRGNTYERMDCMVHEFTRYIYMYGRSRKQFNAYERYAMQIFSHAYLGRNIKALITWIKEFLEEQNIVMTDASFRWYVASIMVVFWYILHDCLHPLLYQGEEVEHVVIKKENWEILENTLQQSIDERHRKLVLRYLNYTNRYHRSVKSLHEVCNQLVSEMIAKMTVRIGFNFGNDNILFEGLMSHLEPLLRRIQDHVQLPEQELPLLSTEEQLIVEQVTACMLETEALKRVQKKEAVYLAMHFIAGLRRRDSVKNKRVLLICGLGYAMLKLIQETLQSEFQIEIVDTIPSYKLQTYSAWEKIDVVLSVMNVEIDCVKNIIQIHPFLCEEDYVKLSNAGVKRKRLLPNLFGVYSRLDFLKEEDRENVMCVMKQELGLRSIEFYKRLHSLRDILRIPDIHMHCDKRDLLQLFSLDEAVNKCFTVEDLIEYPRLWNDKECHLYYTTAYKKIQQTKIVLSITDAKEIYFCILCMEDLFQLPATHELLQLLTHTPFIMRIKNATCVEEIYQIFLFWAGFLNK